MTETNNLLNEIMHTIANHSDESLVENYDNLSLTEQRDGLFGKMIYRELSSRHPRRVRKYETTNLTLRQAILNEPFKVSQSEL